MIGTVVTAIFAANDSLDVIDGGANWDRWAFFIAFLVFASVVVRRILQLDARLDDRERYKKAINALSPLITEGNRALDVCGRPESAHNPVNPMYFNDVCLPKFMKWNSDARALVDAYAPEYLAKFENDGNVFGGVDKKPASVQQLEGRLKRLDEVMDALRSKL